MRTAAAYLILALTSGFAFAQTSGNKFDAGNGPGLPVYPKAVLSEHADGRGTVSLTDGTRAHSVAASAYLSQDKPDKVLQFYRDRLKAKGQVVECSGGKNNDVDVQLNDAAFTAPSACHARDFAASGTLLKLISGDEQKIVVVLPHGNGSEIALVSVDP